MQTSAGKYDGLSLVDTLMTGSEKFFIVIL